MNQFASIFQMNSPPPWLRAWIGDPIKGSPKSLVHHGNMEWISLGSII